MKKNWHLSEITDDEIFRLYSFTGISKYTGSILYVRGIRKKEDVIRFLYPEMNNLHSPFMMSGIHEAVSRIRQALENKEQIGIFADSDLDGITSLTILYDLFTRCGSNPFVRYPKNKEGYGLTNDIIDEFNSAGVRLLITVDSGIRDINEIAYASEFGIDTIITDHHEPDSAYPDAIIINPKMPECRYPFKELAGVGVAFKLAHAFLLSHTGSFNKRFVLINYSSGNYNLCFFINGSIIRSVEDDNHRLKEIINTYVTSDDYVIFADNESEKLKNIFHEIHPLIKTNTLLGLASAISGIPYRDTEHLIDTLSKKYSINSPCYSRNELINKIFLEMQMRSSKKIIECIQIYAVLATVGTIADIMPLQGENRSIIQYGLEILKKGEGHRGIQFLVTGHELSAKNIAWDIAPLLNTPGRFGETGLTVNFFITSDDRMIQGLIGKIEKLNRERKKIVTSVTEQIKTVIASDNYPYNKNIFFYMGSEILSGLAGLIASRIADELKKPVIIAVAEPDSNLVKGSGRSCDDFNFFSFVTPFSDMFEKIGGHAQAFGFTAKKSKIHEIIRYIDSAIIYENESILKIDSKIDINEINIPFLDELSRLEPFGKNNEEPVFLGTEINIDSFTKFGINENHGKFILNNGLHAIGWNLAEKMELFFSKGNTLDIVFNVEKHIYLNRTLPRLKIIDLDIS